MKIRKIPGCTVITHGDEPKTFTLRGGLYIPMIQDCAEVQEYFQRDLDAVLRHWFDKKGFRRDAYFVSEYRSEIFGDQGSSGSNPDQNDTQKP